MFRPLIAITTDNNDADTAYASNYEYAAAVEKAGGLPLLLPYRTDLALIPHYVDRMDGVLFTGGWDLDPALWGESYAPGTQPIDPSRQRFELALMEEVERRRIPTLGICLGCQLMNVYRGGSMFQFLPEHVRESALEHRKGDAEPWNCHDVTVEPDSILGQLLGKRCLHTNTSHKQGINRVGKGLRVIATSPDGIVEGVEDTSLPLWLGVQWHPERLTAEPDHLAVFKLLVEKAAAHRAARIGHE